MKSFLGCFWDFLTKREIESFSSESEELEVLCEDLHNSLNSANIRINEYL